MSRRTKIALWAVGAGSVLVILAVTAAVLVLQSAWFREKVHNRMIAEVEKATGGRVESGPVSFDWKHLGAAVDNFVLHGTEPAGSAPLFRAKNVRAGLKILSVLETKVDLERLEVDQPEVHLMIGPDGSTNVPRPKVRRSHKNALETIVDLAVRHFDLERGSFEIEGKTRTPFSAKGQNLRVKFLYELAGARYQGDVGTQPLDVRWGSYTLVPATVNFSLAAERNRIQVPTATVVSGKSRVEFHGALDNVVAGQGVFQYNAQTELGELGRILREPELERGDVKATGEVRIAGFGNTTAAGKVSATGVRVQLKDFRIEEARMAETPFETDLQRVEWKGVRVAGRAMTTINRQVSRFPVAANVRTVVLEKGSLRCDGVVAEAMDGVFTGRADFPRLKRVLVDGEVRGFDVRRLTALVTPRGAPWDGQMAGPLRVNASLNDARDATVDGEMSISPAASGPAVSGLLAVHYESRHNTVDLGDSNVSLPHTEMNFSGTLGTQLRVHLQTRDLGDLMPGIDLISSSPPKSLPIELHNGRAQFDGTVTGPLASPAIDGRVALANFMLAGQAFDSFRGGVSVSETAGVLRDGVAVRHSAQANVSGTIGFQDWKPVNESALSATVTLRNAAITDLLEAAGRPKTEITGSLGVSGKAWGTYGQPHAEMQVNAAKGAIYGEPYDLLTATVSYGDDTAQVSHAHLAAGGKQITAEVSYRHQAGSLQNGRLVFQVASNLMDVSQFKKVVAEQPGAGGTVQFRGSGEVETLAKQAGSPVFRIHNLNGELTARGLKVAERQYGEVHVTAESKGSMLSGELDSNFAGAAIHGWGQWRLADDNPGNGEVTFSKVDLQKIQQALAISPGGFQAAGSVEGGFKLSGPALEPALWTGTLRIPHFQAGPAKRNQIPNQANLTLTNSGPMVFQLERGIMRVESARFVGRSTDLSLAGTVAFAQRNALDLKVNGRVDLAVLHDYSADVTSSGFVMTDATVRGSLQRPLVNGRLELKDAAVNLAGFPNGLANGNGVILFNANGATIQSLTGETGGGKVSISGFAGYEANQAVFRLQATADEVRVRYPEGVSTVSDAKLSWTGTTESNLLAGTVTVQHSGFNPRTDLSSVLSQSAQPVQTPAARTGLLAGTHFDVVIETSPALTVQSSLTQDMVMEGNLRLRGTFSNPAVLGRINVVQGQLVFFGTKYTIDQGSVSFFNPVRVEPVINVDLQTKARGIDVILNIAGPLNKLALTPRSDPPMPFSEIVSLLATGRSPTATEVPLATSQQVTGANTYQQMGASALLTEAVASPVAGRLQRFFGITKLRIDPTLTGVEFNPQARLTLEQNLTPNITFTYITNITQSNPLVVQIEWALNPRWSVIAVRDENALFGIDFFYKKRFH